MTSGEVFAMIGAHQRGQYVGEELGQERIQENRRPKNKYFMEVMNLKLTLEERKVLYAYGCTNHHNTITRLKWLTALAVDRDSKRKLLRLAQKIDHKISEENYQAFYFYIRTQMEDYFKSLGHCRLIEAATDYEEDAA